MAVEEFWHTHIYTIASNLFWPVVHQLPTPWMLVARDGCRVDFLNHQFNDILVQAQNSQCMQRELLQKFEKIRFLLLYQCWCLGPHTYHSSECNINSNVQSNQSGMYNVILSCVAMLFLEKKTLSHGILYKQGKCTVMNINILLHLHLVFGK